jgi:hypothetical protein
MATHADDDDDDAISPDAATPLRTLPREVALAIFARLPVDARARCAAVCPGWCAFLAAEVSLWTQLDLTPTMGGVTRLVTEALLRGAAARAVSGLQALQLPKRHCVSQQALLAVVAGNAATLRELRVPSFSRWEHLSAVAHAAPQLRVFETGASTNDTSAEALHMVRREPPYGGLTLCHFSTVVADDDDATLALASALAAHAGLDVVHLYGVTPPLQGGPLRAPAALEAVVDAALVRRMTELQLWSCGTSPASVPALVRLLSSTSLTSLWIVNDGGGPLLDARATTLLCGALRANTTLTELALSLVHLFDDVATATAVLDALAAHQPRLRVLDLEGNHAADPAAIGRALSALLLTLPLHTLNVNNCGLGDEGLGPLVDALPSSAHLHTLECFGNGASEAFLHERLLPAVLANTSLRYLHSDADMAGRASLHVDELLQARLDADEP